MLEEYVNTLKCEVLSYIVSCEIPSWGLCFSCHVVCIIITTAGSESTELHYVSISIRVHFCCIHHHRIYATGSCSNYKLSRSAGSIGERQANILVVVESSLASHYSISFTSSFLRNGSHCPISIVLSTFTFFFYVVNCSCRFISAPLNASPLSDLLLLLKLYDIVMRCP